MRKIAIIVIIFFVVSCKNDIKQEENISINVPILTQKDQFNLLDYSNCFLKIELNQLETTDESVLQYVNAMEYCNDKLYFLNYQSGNILIFNIDGSFVYNFNRFGNGPHEYTNIKGFDVDSLGNIHVLTYKNIVVYDSLFNYQDKIPIKDKGGARNIERISDSKYLIVYNYEYRDKHSYRHAIFDFQTNKYEYFFENELKTPSFDYITHSFDDQVLISPPFYEYNIYVLDNDRVKSKYIIDFGSLKLTKKELMKEKLKVMDGRKQLEWLNIKNKAVQIRYFWDTPKYIFFEYNVNGAIHNAIHNKANGITNTSEFRHRISPNGARIEFSAYSTKDNCLIGLIYPHMLNEITESYLLSQEQIDFLNSVDKNANPILVKYYLK